MMDDDEIGEEVVITSILRPGEESQTQNCLLRGWAYLRLIHNDGSS